MLPVTPPYCAILSQASPALAPERLTREVKVTIQCGNCIKRNLQACIGLDMTLPEIPSKNKKHFSLSCEG